MSGSPQANNVGQIISPQRRNQIAREFKNTHFQLGEGGKNTMMIEVAGRSYVSTFRAEYVPHSMARTSVDFKSKENQTRGSNF